MPKINRGTTIKLSIRLSTIARQKIESAAKNLGISLAGVILFELTKLLKNPPSLSEIAEIENRITLERKHFVLTVNETLMEKVNNLAEDYDQKKNVLIGYIVSNHFDKYGDPEDDKDIEPKKIMVQVNESLKKKMMEYSEKHFIPLNAIVTYSILQGPYEGLPTYDDEETVQFFTNVPAYIGELVKEGAVEHNIREHFYTSLCIYKQVMMPGGRFIE
ncbi:hypothetical protein [Peribacillus simplex]|uniref:CopG family transcriptional regulator n=1 Tax=Peribacillus simplex TaxID=1478 RepID=A0AAW7I4Y7_9BACI|nr:hypothetical protein [Peribacillus simplex]MDM5451038.1 hypothetical protein [Peribacillus simplex]